MRILPNDRASALPSVDVAPAVRTLAASRRPPPERAAWVRRLLPALAAWGLYDRALWTPTDAGHVLASSEGPAAAWAMFWCLLRADGDFLLAALRLDSPGPLDGWRAARALRALAASADEWQAHGLSLRAAALEDDGPARAAAARVHFRPLWRLGLARPNREGLALSPAGEALRASVTSGDFARGDASSLLESGASRAFLAARDAAGDAAPPRPASAGELLAALLAAPSGLRVDMGLPSSPLDALTAWLQGRFLARGERVWVDEAHAAALARSDTTALGGHFELCRGQSVGECNLVWRGR